MFVFGGHNVWRNQPSYAYYGWKDDEKIFSLNLKNETWSQVDNITYQNGGHTANLIGNVIYLCGGYN